MNDRFRISTGVLLGILLLAGLSIYHSFYPLWHTDVWAHAKYGEWYWTHRGAPDVEPLSPFSDKSVPFANVAWLSQVTYYLLYETGATIAGGDAESRLLGGAEALRSFHLILLMGRFVLLWLALRRFGNSNNWATLGLFLYVMAVGFGSAIQRPQAFGLLFFTAIIYELSAPRLSRATAISLPIMFLLWANLHGTFMAGLALLGFFTLGRLIEKGIRDGEVRRLILVGLLCGLATLVNPHGPWIYPKLLAFSAHPNLKTMTEWYPMRITAASGAHWPYLMSLLLLVFVRVLGGRKVGLSGWFVAIPFALWPWLQARMLLWWWTVVVWLLARLGPGLGDRFPTMPTIPEGELTRGKAWIAVVAIVAAIVAFPPIRSLIPGMKQDLDHTMSAETPWRLGLELNAKPADEGRWLPALRQALNAYYPDGKFRGAIFPSDTQGEFLLWELPAEMPVLMYEHAHVFPVDHWEACRDAMVANPGWHEFLAGKQVNLIVIEVEPHGELAEVLRADPEWIVVLDGPWKPGSVGRSMLVALRKKGL